MPDTDAPAGGTFNQLLEAMPRIAEVANSFTSEENQRSALAVLLRALGMPDQASAGAGVNLSIVPPLPGSQPEDHEGLAGSKPDGQPGTAKRRARKPTAKKSWTRVQDINFRPTGKESLRDVVAAKAPATLFEKNLVVVYYLEDVLMITPITVGHVLAGYHEAGWKSPGNPDNSLAKTSSLRHWLDTSDTAEIHMTHIGRNTVEHDMPIKKDNKSA